VAAWLLTCLAFTVLQQQLCVFPLDISNSLTIHIITSVEDKP